MLNDPSVLKRLAQLVPVKINVDKPAGSALGRQLGLKGVPAIVFAKPSGEVVHLFTGGVSVEDFLVHLDSAEAVFRAQTPGTGDPGSDSSGEAAAGG